MATERFALVVTSTGAQQASAGIAGIGQAATQANAAVSQANRTMAFFRQALVAFAAIRAAGHMIDLADAALRMENRLKVTTKSAEQFARAQQFISDISRRTFTDIEANTTVYTRLLRATDGLGFSSKQLENTMEALTAGVRIGGATSQEARNAMIQFSQALASGALRGDELRSVAEQLPAVANAIGKAFHMSGGQLIAFAKANPGILETKKVVQALSDAMPELVRQAALMGPTIEQSFTVLRSNFIEMIGDANRSTGVLNGLASAVLILADNIRAVTEAIVALGSAWLALRMAAWAATIYTAVAAQAAFTIAIYGTSGAMAALNFVLAGFGIMSIVTAGIAALVAALVLLYMHSETVRAIVAEFGRELMTVFTVISDVANAIISFFTPAWNALGNVMDVVTTIFRGLSSPFQVFSEYIKMINDALTSGHPAWVQLIDAIIAAVDPIKFLSEAFGLFVQVLLSPVVGALYLIVRVLYELGRVTDQTMIEVNTATKGFFSFQGIAYSTTQTTGAFNKTVQETGEVAKTAAPLVTQLARGTSEYNKMIADSVSKQKYNAQVQADIALAMGKTATETTKASRATQEYGNAQKTTNIYLRDANVMAGGITVSIEKSATAARNASVAHKLLADIFGQVGTSAAGAARSVDAISGALNASVGSANSAASAYNNIASAANNAAVAMDRAARSNSSAGIIRGGGVPFGDPGYHATGGGSIGITTSLTGEQAAAASQIGSLAGDAFAKGLISSTQKNFFEALSHATGVTKGVRGLGMTTAGNMLTGTGLQGGFASITSGNFSNSFNAPSVGYLTTSLEQLQNILKRYVEPNSPVVTSTNNLVNSNHGLAGAMFSLSTGVQRLTGAVEAQARNDYLNLARENVSPLYGPTIRENINDYYSAVAGFSRGGGMGMSSDGRVGGFGPPDSKIVPVRLSPNEDVHFTPRGQGGGGGTTTVQMKVDVNIQANNPAEFRHARAEIENVTSAAARRALRRAGVLA